jgi:hypothetical protein
MQADQPASGGVAWSAAAPEPVSTVPVPARPFQGCRAGLVSRVLASAVDGAVVVILLAVGYAGVAAALFLWQRWAFTVPSPSLFLVLALGAGVSVVYLAATWATGGRSYGDHLLGLRVLGPWGRLRLGGALLRAVVCVAFPIGLLWVAVSRDNRSLQDVVLRTSVVYDWHAGEDAVTQAQPPIR